MWPGILHVGTHEAKWLHVGDPSVMCKSPTARIDTKPEENNGKINATLNVCKRVDLTNRFKALLTVRHRWTRFLMKLPLSMSTSSVRQLTFKGLLK